jgi:hypothetical protein
MCRSARLPRATRVPIRIDRLGDAEVEQLRFALGGDQDVGGLEVAVHDQVAMCVGDGCTDLQRQAQAGAHIERVRIAIARDRAAFDILEREVRRTVVRDAAVMQLGDMRMDEAREEFAFAQEALAHLGTDEIAAHTLERHALDEIAVLAFGQVDAAHATLAEQAQQAVGTDALADQAYDLDGNPPTTSGMLDLGPFEKTIFFDGVDGT